MLNKFRALGLALVAVFAMSALIASSASAATFTAVDGSTQNVEATDVGAEDVFVVSGSTLTCQGETFAGHLPAGQSTSLTVDPNWINCKTEGASSNNVTVTDNGCGIIFQTTPNGIYIECPQTPTVKAIEVHHYQAGSSHSSSTCTETIGTQTPVNLKGPTYTNQAGGHVEAHGEAEVSLQTHGACSFGFTLNQKAVYTYSVTVKGSTAGIHVK